MNKFHVLYSRQKELYNMYSSSKSSDEVMYYAAKLQKVTNEINLLKKKTIEQLIRFKD